MSGEAMFTIVTSRKLMKTPTEVTSRTCQRRAISEAPKVVGDVDPLVCNRLSQWDLSGAE